MMRPHFTKSIVMLCAAGLAILLARAAAAQADRTILPADLELNRLVDLCAERLGIDIEYDAAVLQGRVTLRLREGVTNDELWTLTNGLLASRGFATVQRPGEKIVAVVRLADAPAAARLEMPEAPATSGGFSTIVTRITHREVAPTIEALRNVLSKTGSAAIALGETRLVLLSDTKPRIDQALHVLEMIDVPSSEPEFELVESRFVAATQLAGLVTAAAQARDTIAYPGARLRGKVTATADNAALMIVAPEEELPHWRSFIDRFDQRGAVETRTYIPMHFAAGEVAPILEQAVRDPSPRGSGDRWKLIVNELTGTLIITAALAEHVAIADLLDRLDTLPPEMRQQTRAFRVRNRAVREVAEVISQLIETGVLEAGGFEPRLDPSRPRLRQQQEHGPLAGVSPLHPGVESVGPMQPPTPGAAGLPGLADQPAAARDTLPARRPGLFADRPITITADEGTNSIIAVGPPRLLDALGTIIQGLDVRQPQVMLEVLVIGLTDTDTLDLGVELEKIEVHGDTMFRIASLFGLSDITALSTIPDLPDRGLGISILRPGDFMVIIRALEAINRGRTLNIPRVLVNNNQEAVLDSVLQRPFATIGAGVSISTTAFAGTLDAGTTVTVRPQIAEGDHLVLEYAVSLSAFVGDSPDPTLPPPRQQNNLQSVVTIPDGYVVAVGGLETLSDTEAISQIPLLGDLPLLGEAFKKRTRTKSRSRFFVFIRADSMRRRDFEDLKFMSTRDAVAAGIDDGFPVVEPRVIH